eukprot:6719227-Alexandrium_andersonii.AAC.1
MVVPRPCAPPRASRRHPAGGPGGRLAQVGDGPPQTGLKLHPSRSRQGCSAPFCAPNPMVATEHLPALKQSK